MRNFQTVHSCINGCRVVNIILIRCEWLEFYPGAFLSLDSDMISIDDEVRLDYVLNPNCNPAHIVSQARMSTSDSSGMYVPEVVEIQDDDSSNTSGLIRSTNSNNTCNNMNLDRGDEEPIVKVENISSAASLATSSQSAPIVVAQTASHNVPSFKTLIVPVATPVNPTTSKTIYAGVTSTDLSIHDLAIRILSSSTSETLFDGDFVLKNNIAESLDLSCIYILIDRSKYKLKIIPCVIQCPIILYQFL